MATKKAATQNNDQVLSAQTDLKAACDRASKLLPEQNVKFNTKPEKAKELLDMILVDYPKMLQPKVQAFLPLHTNMLDWAIYGYNKAVQEPEKLSLLMATRDTNTTSVTSNLMPFIKLAYPKWEDYYAANPDIWVYNNVQLPYEDGEPKIFQVKEGYDKYSWYLFIGCMKYVIEQYESVKMATLEELMKADISQELKAIVFERNPEALAKILTEIDSYVDNKQEQYLIGTTKDPQSPHYKVDENGKVNSGMSIGVYTLYTGEINGIKISYVRCYCPSTDRQFYLSVEPKFKKAEDAIASLLPVPKKLAKNITSISRQGERFSLTLDEAAKQLIRDGKLSKEDYADTVNLTGKQYFELMRYEY